MTTARAAVSPNISGPGVSPPVALSFHRLAERELKMGFAVLLHGETGVGKTTFAMRHAARLKAPLFSVAFDNRYLGFQLTGTLVEGRFVAGSVLKAVDAANETGIAVLLLDEVNVANPASTLPLTSLLDNRRSISIPVLGEVRRLGSDSKLDVIATLNPGLMGTIPPNGAFLSRFQIVDCTLTDEDLRMIACHTMKGSLDQTAEQLLGVFIMLRKALVRKSLWPTPRDLVSWLIRWRESRNRGHSPGFVFERAAQTSRAPETYERFFADLGLIER